MSVMPIGPLPGIAGPGALPSLPVVGAPSTSGVDFTEMVTGGLERLQGMHQTSDQLAVQAATGDLTDIHDYMIASTQSSVATELTVAVRNKAVEAFTEIMRMQV